MSKQITIFLEKEEDNIVSKYQNKWKKEGMDGTSKNAIIRRIIREFNK